MVLPSRQSKTGTPETVFRNSRPHQISRRDLNDVLRLPYIATQGIVRAYV